MRYSAPLDNPIRMQRRDGLRVISGFGQHGVGVLAEFRNRAHPPFIVRHAERRPDESDRAIGRGSLLQHAAMHHLPVRDDLVERMHAAEGDVGPFQARFPFRGVACRQR